MIIDFSGTHATGKTTLIKNLMEELDGGCIELPSVSRTEGDLKVYNRCDDADQIHISLQNWGNIIEAAREFDYVLCTDLGIRSFAYTMGFDAENPTHRFHEQAVALFTSPEFKSWYNPVFFYLPVEFSMERDGFRVEDEEYRTNIASLHNSIIVRVNQKFPRTVFELTGSVEHRMDFARRHLIERGAKFKRDILQPTTSI